MALAAAVAAVVAAAGGAGTATLLARSGAESPIVAQGAETGRAPSTGAATTTSPGPSLTPTPSPAAEQTVAIRPSEARSEKPRTTTRPPAPQQDEEEPESSAPRSSPPSEDFPTDPAATPSPQRPKPSPTPTRLVELGAGHFSAYCVTLGWEWVEYRETPRPGAYCVKRKNDQTMYLTQAQRDDGCRWRFKVPNAFHRFKGKANYCYVYR
ncbi:hypothetical protein [Thermocatellispora tengchongensis]|uniref:hypothetical protein n=1 Tax=Thermocatellispora tengchongensis TaxID=1073253 RepID=UPI00363E5489